MYMYMYVYRTNLLISVLFYAYNMLSIIKYVVTVL